MKFFSYGLIVCLTSALALFSPAQATEKDTCGKEALGTFASTVIGIKRNFPDDEVVFDKGVRVYGGQGTAWRFDTTSIATIEHIATGLNLSPLAWKPVTLFVSNAEYEKPIFEYETEARIAWITDDDEFDGGARIEIKDPLPNLITIAHVRDTPMKNGEQALAAGYTGGILRYATGRLNFPTPDPEAEGNGKPIPYLPFELADNDKTDRLALDYGASGAPIFDCEGKVVAVVAVVVTQNMSAALGGMMNTLKSLGRSGIDVDREILDLSHISTHWGMYNVLAAPATDIPRE